jgi:hypothetical protein
MLSVLHGFLWKATLLRFTSKTGMHLKPSPVKQVSDRHDIKARNQCNRKVQMLLA